jgi:predicted kinase
MVLILIRGLPGSGKSTLAQQLKDQKGYRHFEADQYFVDSSGRYHFDATKLNLAHAWCQNRTKAELLKGHSVVVSNTFIRLWELNPYLLLAKKLGVDLNIIECHTNYGTIHSISTATLHKMATRWQPLPVHLQSAIVEIKALLNH